jgi:Tol biopolymer transport system component
MAAKILITFLPFIYLLSTCASNRFIDDARLDPGHNKAVVVEPERVTAGNDSSYSPALSPNGLYLFFTSERGGNKDIYVKNVKGGYPSQITSHPADDFSPAMSPDGKLVVFVSRRDDARGGLFMTKLKTSARYGRKVEEGEVASVVKSRGETLNPSWYPDSRRIVYSLRQPGDQSSRICTAAADDPGVDQCFEGISGDYPSVSNDSGMLTYSRHGQIFLYDIAASRELPLTEKNEVINGSAILAGWQIHLLHQIL